MLFHEHYIERVVAWLAAKYVDQHTAAVGGAYFDGREIVESLGGALVDAEVGGSSGRKTLDANGSDISTSLGQSRRMLGVVSFRVSTKLSPLTAAIQYKEVLTTVAEASTGI